jgi:hypothetical protein
LLLARAKEQTIWATLGETVYADFQIDGILATELPEPGFSLGYIAHHKVA